MMRGAENEIRGYNAGAMLLHWAIAVAILFQIAGGFTMMRLDILPDAIRFAFFQWHKTIGILVLTLTLARIAWRVANPPPAHAPMTRLEAGAAHLVHAALYALMLLVPLSGWLVVSISPTAIPTYLFLAESLRWPNLPVPSNWIGEEGASLAGSLHTWLAYSTLALFVVHVAGALKHSVVDRQPSLRRILPVGRLPRQSTALLAVPLALGLAASFFVGGVAVGQGEGEAANRAPLPANDPTSSATNSGWVIDKAGSTLGYETVFSGKPMTGAIGNWNAAIRFDPSDLSNASAQIDIDATSITVADAFVRGNVAGQDGFESATHPTIRVVLSRFETAGTGFIGHGEVSVKGKTIPVDVPFDFRRAGDGTAGVSGSAVLDRLALGLGLKNDPTAQWLAREVTVRFDLKARPAGAVAPAS